MGQALWRLGKILRRPSPRRKAPVIDSTPKGSMSPWNLAILAVAISDQERDAFVQFARLAVRAAGR